MRKEEFITNVKNMLAQEAVYPEIKGDLDSVIQQAIAEEKEKTCKWTLSDMMDDVYESETWKPGCEQGDGWEYPQGEAFTDEIVGYIYCPFCGRKIERV